MRIYSLVFIINAREHRSKIVSCPSLPPPPCCCVKHVYTYLFYTFPSPYGHSPSARHHHHHRREPAPQDRSTGYSVNHANAGCRPSSEQTPRENIFFFPYTFGFCRRPRHHRRRFATVATAATDGVFDDIVIVVRTYYYHDVCASLQCR